MTTDKVPVRFFDILPALLLTAAHVLACLALITFRRNVGEFPLASTGFALYLLATVGAVVAMIALFSRVFQRNTAFNLQMVFAPAFASIALAIALGLTPRLGGATYAPYDPMDDVLGPLTFMCSVVIVCVAIWYKSRTFLLYSFIIQFVIASILLFNTDVTIDTMFGIVVVYALGFFGFVSATKMLDIFDNKTYGFLLASTVCALLGTFTFYITFGEFPLSGASLGWVSADTIVPLNAWNFIRPLALNMATLSVGAIWIGMVFAFGRFAKEI